MRKSRLLCCFVGWRLLSVSSGALVSASFPVGGESSARSPMFGTVSSEPSAPPSPTDSEPETAVERISKELPLVRALEIAGIVMSQVIFPLGASVLRDGPVDDWTEFWARQNGDRTNAKRFTQALEQLGPVYVKVGQALASRPDQIPRTLAEEMSALQDNMRPFDSSEAKSIVVEELMQSQSMSIKDMEGLLEGLSGEPVAAASVGQVYKAMIGSRPVAVKVQRPGIKKVVERDAALLRTVASFIESLPALPSTDKQISSSQNRLVATDLVDAVEEFMSRVAEELDFRNEAANAATFASLYSHRGGSSKNVRVVVPEIFPDLCSNNVLVMEWLDGTKLTSFVEQDSSTIAENLAIIETGIECTLSQLLDTGVMHADPHGGNLLKVETSEGPMLGYLDFGLLSSVPQTVRDALVCAVAHLVFDRDMEAVTTLFGELQLVPKEVVDDPEDHAALTAALDKTMEEVLVYPGSEKVEGHTQVPNLKFDKLLDSMAMLVPRFRFQLPPYFMNNARALSTLEGIALSLNEEFSVLHVLYPYALNRLLTNPTKSPVVDDTLQCLIRSPETGRIEISRIRHLLNDAAFLTGYGKHRVLKDVLMKSGGRRLARTVIREKISEKFKRRNATLRSKKT